MQNMSMVLEKLLERRIHEDNNKIFGKIIGNKPRTFPEHMKFFVKQELNVMSKYKYQLQSKVTHQMGNLHSRTYRNIQMSSPTSSPSPVLHLRASELAQSSTEQNYCGDL